MSDDALREVLRSPLDELRPPGRGGWAGLAALALAAACGFGATAGIRTLAGGDGTAANATTTTEAAPSTTPAAITPLGDLGVEALAAWRQGGRLDLVVATTILPGAERDEVPAMEGAHWVLRLGEDDLRPATAELHTPLAPGLFTLEVPDTDITGGVELLAYPAVEVVEGEFPTALDSAQLPWEGPPAGTPYRLGGEEMFIDLLRLDDAGGEVVWYLAGDSASRAVVSATATYSEIGGGPQAVVAEPDLPAAWLVTAVRALPATRSGSVHLFHLDDVDSPTYRSRFWGDAGRAVVVEELDLAITVRLYTFAAEPVVIPVDLEVAAEG
jgi:hypothetical protein